MDVPPLRSGRVFVVVMLATLTIFGGLIGGITWRLRSQLQSEVLRREAESIHAVAMLQVGRESPLAQFGAEFALDDMFAAVLESAALRGVLAVQLFDARGRLRQAKPIAPDNVAATRWWGHRPREAVAHFIPEGTLEMASPLLAVKSQSLATIPLLEVVVPLVSRRDGRETAGTARYWMDGEPVAQEFARMDRRLAWQAGLALAGGAALVALVLGWAFFRLGQANRRLEAQRADLARANEELDFAAKTGALGAISAHLIHGLNNPLAGIEGFVAETASGGPDAGRGEACQTAVATTRRLRALVNEVVTVLRDEKGGTADYPVPAREVLQAAAVRAAAPAALAGVAVTVEPGGAAHVSGRSANLAGLVIANLVANAIEASPAGAKVAISARAAAGVVEFLVRDTGPGLPAAVRGDLFRPVRSNKPGGGGVGLAISHRLARHAGGNLDLVHSDAHGTEFRLTVPSVAAA